MSCNPNKSLDTFLSKDAVVPIDAKYFKKYFFQRRDATVLVQYTGSETFH